MKSVLRSSLIAGALVCAIVAVQSPSAWADTFQLDQTVDATTTLAKLHQTVVIPQGTFHGTINESNGAVKGTLRLPPASTTVRIAGIGVATATFSLAPTGPVRGRFHFSTYEIVATSTFNIIVSSVKPLGLPVNLVPKGCGTSSPISLQFHGTISPINGGTVSGTYTIPSLRSCGALTLALTAALAGPNNAFSANLS